MYVYSGIFIHNPIISLCINEYSIFTMPCFPSGTLHTGISSLGNIWVNYSIKELCNLSIEIVLSEPLQRVMFLITTS